MGNCIPLLALLSALASEPVSPNPASLALNKADKERVELLIAQLGAPDFAKRETAQKELSDLGRKAYASLLQAANKNEDPEIRLRSRKLIPAAREADFKARVDTFMADTKNEFKHDLPGLDLFFSLSGKSDAGRTSYLEALKDEENRELLVAADGNKTDLATVVYNRSTQLYYRQYPRNVAGQPYRQGNPPSAMDVILLLAVDSMVPPEKQTRRTGIGSASYMLNNTNFRSAAMNGTGPQAELCRKVVSHWIQSRTETYDLYVGMNFLTNTNQKEAALDAAKKLLATKNSTGIYRGYAITTIGKFAGKDAPEIIKPYIKDDAVITTRFVNANERYTIQIRDVVLATLITNAGQSPKDYGFETQSYSGNVNVLVSATSHWFKTDEDRAAAMKKWDEYVKKTEEAQKKEKK